MASGKCIIDYELTLGIYKKNLLIGLNEDRHYGQWSIMSRVMSKMRCELKVKYV